MITYQIERQQPVGISKKSIFVILRNDTPAVAYRRLEVPLVPIDAVADTYLAAHYTLQSAWDAATAITLQAGWLTEQSPLVQYYASIILSLHDDVGNGAVTIDQMLTNAATIVATNPTQQADFNAYRTRLGLGGAIGTMTTAQKNNLLVIGLGWATAGLTVAKTLNQ